MKQTFIIIVPAVTRWNSETRVSDIVQPEASAHITVEVDFEAIAHRLGAKAARATSRKSIDVGGLVQVRATQLRPTS